MATHISMAADAADQQKSDAPEKMKVIVIGTSMGGIDALKAVLSGLPKSFETPIFIVWHMPADAAGMLPQLLADCTSMKAANATDNEPVAKRRIYTAVPDHHMVLEDGVVRISKGPKENRFRPAIDPLFRSAAYYYGPCATAIILTGGLDDGAAGVWAIKEQGGIVIVQDPAEAVASSMPQHAINAVEADHVVPLSEIAVLLTRLEAVPPAACEPASGKNELQYQEINAALLEKPLAPGISTFGEPSNYACPECHGVLGIINEDGRIRYRCHTGHAYSVESLVEELKEKIEISLWNALRGVSEAAMLLNTAGDELASQNLPREAAGYFQQAAAWQIKSDALTKMLTNEDNNKSEDAKLHLSEEI